MVRSTPEARWRLKEQIAKNDGATLRVDAVALSALVADAELADEIEKWYGMAAWFSAQWIFIGQAAERDKNAKAIIEQVREHESGYRDMLNRLGSDINAARAESAALAERLRLAEAVVSTARVLVEYWRVHHPILLRAEFGKPLDEAVTAYDAALTDGKKESP